MGDEATVRESAELHDGGMVADAEGGEDAGEYDVGGGGGVGVGGGDVDGDDGDGYGDGDGYDDHFDVPGLGDSVEADDRGRWGWATGLATGTLSVVIAVGVLYCLVVGLLVVFVGTTVLDVPAAKWWSAYVDVALCWGVFIGCYTFFMAYRSRRTADVRRVEWLAAGAAGLVLAAFWPGLLLILAVFLAVRSRRSGRTRVAGLAVAAVVAIGGMVWGVTTHGGQDLRTPTGLSVATVAGTWRSDDGGVIALQPDGRVSVTGASGLFVRSTYVSSATETGTWTVTAAGSVGLIADGADDDASVDPGQVLQIYVVDSRPVLCASDDPDTPCGTAFYRR